MELLHYYPEGWHWIWVEILLERPKMGMVQKRSGRVAKWELPL